MADNVGHSVIDNLLKRLDLTKYAENFKERDITRIVNLRALSADVWKEIVPDDEDRKLIIESANLRINLNNNKKGEGFNNPSNDNSKNYLDHQHGANEGLGKRPTEWQQNYRDPFRTATPSQSYHNNSAMNSNQGNGNGYYHNYPNNSSSNHQDSFRQVRRGGGFGNRGRRGDYHSHHNNDDNENTNEHYQDYRNKNSAGSFKFNNHSFSDGPKIMRPCRHFFSKEGCKYEGKCRYRHDAAETPSGFPPTCEPVLEHEIALRECYAHTEELVVPVERVKFLVGARGRNISYIKEKYDVQLETVKTSPGNESENVIFRLQGKTPESVQAAKNDIFAACGFLNANKMKERFNYILHELEIHTLACKSLCAANTANKGTPYEMSEKILRYIISTFRFCPPQNILHFYIETGPGDREKLDKLSKLVAQMDGVHAIIFCEANRVSAMCKGALRLSRCMNNASPIFVHPGMPKEERMRGLEEFKRGAPNDRGVIQRLLVTTSDYAKLARKTEIPYVNFVIHFSQPKSEEFYALQACVVGRHGTLGASVLCTTPSKGAEQFSDLQKTIPFVDLEDEMAFSETSANLTYDTLETPLTLPTAYPPDDCTEDDGLEHK